MNNFVIKYRASQTSTLILLARVLHFLRRKFLDSIVEIEISIETDLLKEVLDGVAFAILEIGTLLFKAFIRTLHCKHAGDKAGARIYCGCKT